MCDKDIINSVVMELRFLAMKARLEGTTTFSEKAYREWAKEIIEIVRKERVSTIEKVKPIVPLQGLDTSVLLWAKNYTISIPKVEVNIAYKEEE